MAVRTTQLARIQGLRGGELRIEIEWEDALATLDPDSGEKHADTGDLLAFRIVNTTPKTGKLIIRRPGIRAPWKDISVPPGTDMTIPPIDVVRQITDANVGIGLGR